jgi:hypothetical protein
MPDTGKDGIERAHKYVVLTYYFSLISLVLSGSLPWLSSMPGRTTTNLKTTRRTTMENTRTQDYFKDDNEGHIDTREQNHHCENPDPHLGCDMGIDVAG